MIKKPPFTVHYKKRPKVPSEQIYTHEVKMENGERVGFVFCDKKKPEVEDD